MSPISKHVTAVLVALSISAGSASGQYLSTFQFDPLKDSAYLTPIVTNTFMQMYFWGARTEEMHPGIDVAVDSFVIAGEPFYAPGFGNATSGTDYVSILSNTQDMNGDYNYFYASHVTPTSYSNPVSPNTQLATAGYGTDVHVHMELAVRQPSDPSAPSPLNVDPLRWGLFAAPWRNTVGSVVIDKVTGVKDGSSDALIVVDAYSKGKANDLGVVGMRMTIVGQAAPSDEFDFIWWEGDWSKRYFKRILRPLRYKLLGKGWTNPTYTVLIEVWNSVGLSAAGQFSGALTSLPTVQLDGEVIGRAVRLSWRVMTGNVTDVGIDKFELYRAPSRGSEGVLVNENPIPVVQDSTLPYELGDEPPSDWDTVSYRLFGVRNDGVKLKLAEQEFFLGAMVPHLSVYPNPFNPDAQIKLELPSPTSGSIRVYDVSGRLVSLVRDGVFPAGVSIAKWTGTNENGSRVSSGIYFIRFDSPGVNLLQKIVHVK